VIDTANRSPLPLSPTASSFVFNAVIRICSHV
jgi:hypothetical protein